jgi:hypothetical protein
MSHYVIFRNPTDVTDFLAKYPSGDSQSFIDRVCADPFPSYFYYQDVAYTNRLGLQTDLIQHADYWPTEYTSLRYACAILDPDAYPEYLL